jgi:hypothetical protein
VRPRSADELILLTFNALLIISAYACLSIRWVVCLRARTLANSGWSNAWLSHPEHAIWSRG